MDILTGTPQEAYSFHFVIRTTEFWISEVTAGILRSLHIFTLYIWVFIILPPAIVIVLQVLKETETVNVINPCCVSGQWRQKLKAGESLKGNKKNTKIAWISETWNMNLSLNKLQTSCCRAAYSSSSKLIIAKLCAASWPSIAWEREKSSKIIFPHPRLSVFTFCCSGCDFWLVKKIEMKCNCTCKIMSTWGYSPSKSIPVYLCRSSI